LRIWSQQRDADRAFVISIIEECNPFQLIVQPPKHQQVCEQRQQQYADHQRPST
jgi:hypothetical protein